MIGWLFWGMVLAAFAAGLLAVLVKLARMSPEERARRMADARKLQEQARASEAVAGRGDTVIEVWSRRPTLTRTAGGLLLGGPIGAFLGFAWRKKDRQRIRLPK